MRLYVNIDHVATVRQARRTDEPDPVRAAVLAELGGAEGITVHLREDRRHIDDRDVDLLMQTVRTGVNLELSSDPDMVERGVALRPFQVTLVPERREEVTTEGGLALADGSVLQRVEAGVRALHEAGIRVSLFVDPDPGALEGAATLGVEAIELHTGEYANADRSGKPRELGRLHRGARLARELGLAVHAGHGLTYENVIPVAAIPEIEEVNIGHSVVARAVFVGLERAVREMKALVRSAPERVAEPGDWLPPQGFR